MNKRYKFKKATLSIILLITCIFVFGCKPKEKNTAQEIAQNFLEKFFTSNYENRYTKFLEGEDSDSYSAYYDTFQSPISEKCMELLQQNRMPFKYDKANYEDGVSYKVSDIDIEFDSSGTGSYEVLLETKDGGQTSQKATGQITIQDGEITNFHLSNIVPSDK